MLELTNGRKGAIAEAYITATALDLGINVLRPLAEGGRYDLILDFGGGRLERVQCKWGRLSGDVIVARTGTCRHTPRGYVRGTYTEDEVDAVAIWCAAIRRCFYLPISMVAGKFDVHLRLSPAKNNQRVGVTMADDHELGAIAQLGERLRGTQEVAGSSPASST